MIKPFDMSITELERLLSVARGDMAADLLLRGGRLVNVLSGEIYPAEVAISGYRIAGISGETGVYRARHEVDLGGEYIAPGFVDAHVHMESSLLLPAEFANAVLPLGTTSVVSDPHEIANVHGLDGIRFMLQASEGLALRVFVMLSSCVPATHMETAGAQLSAADLAALLDSDRVLGIAEVMNYPGVVGGTTEVLSKVWLGHQARLRVDGHAPLVGGSTLQAYAAAGITSDHESVSAHEALAKLRAGMQVLIREGSTARNLDALLPIVNARTSRFCSFCTDDRQPEDLVTQGHMDYVIRRAISGGLDPVTALQMATINTARHYGLNDLGAIAPGCIADMVTFGDLNDLRVTRTFSGGRLVAEQGRLKVPQASQVALPPNHMLAPGLTERSFAIPARGGEVRVIGVIPDQIVTEEFICEVPMCDGQVVASPESDLLKIAVIERHSGSGNVGLGLVRGFGLREGALASSIAHDSHNLVVVGASDAEMLLAARSVIAMGGGISAARGADVLSKAPLPIAGLMSDRPLETVRAQMAQLLSAARSLGCLLDNPYMAMAFLALPVIPSLKITDMGLVDVNNFRLTSLFVGSEGTR